MKYFNKFLFIFFIYIAFTNLLFAQQDHKEELIVGNTINRVIEEGEKHVYTVQLNNGMAIIGKVTQQGIDIVIDVYKPDGKLIKQIDSPNGTNGVEPIDITANISGLYKIIIHPLDQVSKKGSYILKTEQILSFSENTKRITKKELPTETLYNVWKSSLTDIESIDKFIAKHTEKHIIEPILGDTTDMLVTYFCIPHHNTEYVILSGGPDFLGLRFQRLVNTKLYFVTQRVPKDARFNYSFRYFNLDRAGPNDEIQYRNVENAYNGTLEMPDCPKQNYIYEGKNVEKGELYVTSIKSKILNKERKITIHTPANYDPKEAHNLLLIFDGESYGARLNRSSRVPTPIIMDNLISEKKIMPTVTVLVWSMGTRSKDLISKQFGNFIAIELIPWVQKKYHIYPNANNVALAGSSRGAFAASYIAFRYSDVVGNVLSQSGSYWIKGNNNENHWTYPEDDGKLISAYKNSIRLPIKFYMDVGLYDAGASMLGMNRQFRDILKVKGYDVEYREFKGGHSYVNWRGTLSDGIIALFGTDKN